MKNLIMLVLVASCGKDPRTTVINQLQAPPATEEKKLEKVVYPDCKPGTQCSAPCQDKTDGSGALYECLKVTCDGLCKEAGLEKPEPWVCIYTCAGLN